MKKSLKLTVAALSLSAIVGPLSNLKVEAIDAPAFSVIAGNWRKRSLEDVQTSVNEMVALGNKTYVVQWGDTLSTIAAATGISVIDLAAVNQISNADLIISGSVLYFDAVNHTLTYTEPSGDEVTVAAEETQVAEVIEDAVIADGYLIEEIDEWEFTEDTLVEEESLAAEAEAALLAETEEARLAAEAEAALLAETEEARLAAEAEAALLAETEEARLAAEAEAALLAETEEARLAAEAEAALLAETEEARLAAEAEAALLAETEEARLAAEAEAALLAETEEARLAAEAEAALLAETEEARLAAEAEAALLAETEEANRLAAEAEAALLAETEEARLAAEAEAALLAETEEANRLAAEAEAEAARLAAEEEAANSTDPTVYGTPITVEATAYSRNEAGLGNFTADGTDLRNESAVIAVDPSVIPLGTLVYIPGWGYYRAADTGGAIQGNKIDVHFENVADTYQFGRQSITIYIVD